MKVTTVVVMMTVMMIDMRFLLPADFRETASSAKALFLSTPSRPAMQASVSHPMAEVMIQFLCLQLNLTPLHLIYLPQRVDFIHHSISKVAHTYLPMLLTCRRCSKSQLD